MNAADRSVLVDLVNLSGAREANARLIAAAPDLLAAIEQFFAASDQDESGPMDEAYFALKAAVAKATGASR